jgi:hypothetical protein
MVEPKFSTKSTGNEVCLVLCELSMHISSRGCVCSHVLKVDVNLYGSTTSMYRVDECLSHNHFLHMFLTVDVKPADGRTSVFLHIYRK